MTESEQKALIDPGHQEATSRGRFLTSRLVTRNGKEPEREMLEGVLG